LTGRERKEFWAADERRQKMQIRNFVFVGVVGG
jgi:hypothetical protein